MIGNGLSIIDSDFHGIEPSRRQEKGQIESVKIGNNVWFGMNVIIEKWVNVGDDSIVKVGDVVTHDIIPSNVIDVGVPARVIKDLQS